MNRRNKFDSQRNCQERLSLRAGARSRKRHKEENQHVTPSRHPRRAWLAQASRASAAFVAASSFALDRGAMADVVTAQFNGNASFQYEIIHMPDLDQRRGAGSGVVALPNDGAMYCVPTSTMNMMRYIANHGFPAVLPGPGNWQDQGVYNAAGLNVFGMGLLMDTDPVNGTGGNGWLDGGKDWLNQNSEGSKFTVKHEYFSGLLGPNLNSVTQDACQGNPVLDCDADVTRNGIVDVDDLLGVIHAWGICP